jgi:hypothetical protein
MATVVGVAESECDGLDVAGLRTPCMECILDRGKSLLHSSAIFPPLSDGKLKNLGAAFTRMLVTGHQKLAQGQGSQNTWINQPFRESSAHSRLSM